MNAEPLILVVDDEPYILNMVAEILSDEGYHVEKAADGHEALMRLSASQPKLILLDLMMPRMDGYTFQRTLEQKSGPKPPVVVVSADRNVAQKAAALGAAGYLTKPFELHDLLHTVQRYVPSPVQD
jgi:CheY-like chemotaxis protein